MQSSVRVVQHSEAPTISCGYGSALQPTKTTASTLRVPGSPTSITLDKPSPAKHFIMYVLSCMWMLDSSILSKVLPPSTKILKSKSAMLTEVLTELHFSSNDSQAQPPQVVSILNGCPSQNCPPLSGIGFLHVLANNFFPRPQVTNYGDASIQENQPLSSIAGFSQIENMQVINQCKISLQSHCNIQIRNYTGAAAVIQHIRTVLLVL